MADNKQTDGTDPTLLAPVSNTVTISRPPWPVADAAPTEPPSAPLAASDAGDFEQLAAIDPLRYSIGEELARGGMGAIRVARDRRLGRPVAIKELLPESESRTHRDDRRARFEREALITAKLQHPSIVNILEAGLKPGGEPFYVMKLVAGTSLDKAIAARPTLEARLGLLPNVIAAVDALAYAHSMRVIHRDLKPHNVLVGDFGETVVIDWGLAKDLADTTGAPDVPAGPHRSPPSQFGETVEGAVMGTPAYMPIEQALGQPVDERADVYALGAMLYQLLAAHAPYRGNTTNDVLRSVIATPPAPIDTLVPGLSPDLVTIVNRAMARVADDRYPTAKQLADDLKKFQTGKLVGAHQYTAWQLVRRSIRRHRATFAVGSVAVVILAAVGFASVRRIVVEQSRTEDQRRVAEHNRGEAEELTSFMLGDLATKLRPLGRLDLLDTIATKAITYYDRRAESLSGAELGKTALARRNLGDVLYAEGRVDEALREFRLSALISTVLAEADPSSDEQQRAVSVSRDRVGNALIAQGDSAGALVEYEATLAIDKARAAVDPQDEVRQRDLSMSYEKVGNLRRTERDTAAALVAYRTSLSIITGLAAKNPGSGEHQRALSLAHQQIGQELLTQGNATEALAEDHEAVAVARALTARDPSEHYWQERLAEALAAEGTAKVDRDATAALVEFREALAIVATLAASDPANEDWQRDLASFHGDVGDALVKRGESADALTEYRSAQAISLALAARNPSDDAAQQSLAASDRRLGEVLSARGDSTGALVAYRAALAINDKLTAKSPTNGKRAWDLALIHNRVGDLLFESRDLSGALVEFRAARALRELWAMKDPGNADARAALSVCHDKIGKVLEAQGDVDGAVVEYRAELEIDAATLAADPTNAGRRSDLSISRQRLGTILLARKDAAGALVENRAERELCTALVAQDPQNAEWQERLAQSNDDIADAELALGDATAALAGYRAAFGIRESQLKAKPTDPERQDDVVTSQSKIADALVALGRKAEALALYRTALVAERRLVADNPNNAEYRDGLADIEKSVATCCATPR